MRGKLRVRGLSRLISSPLLSDDPSTSLVHIYLQKKREDRKRTDYMQLSSCVFIPLYEEGKEGEGDAERYESLISSFIGFMFLSYLCELR